MNRQIKLFLWIMLIDLLSITMGTIFINVFLMRIADDFSNVLMFNAASFLFLMTGFVLLGSVSKKMSKKIGVLIGNLCSILLYTIVILLQEDVNDIVWLLAVISGLSQGFYWLSMNTMLLDLCDEQYRQKLNAWNGAVNSLCQLSSPLIASGIVACFPLMRGYQVLFTVIIVLMVTCTLLCIFVKTKPSSQAYSLRTVMNREGFAFYKTSCRFTAEIFFRDGAVSSILNVLIFQVVQSEFMLSAYISYMMMLSLLVYLLLTRLALSERRLFHIGTLSCSCAMILLAVGLQNLWMIFVFVTLFGIGSPVCMYYMTLHAQTITYKLDDEAAYSLEYTILKEIAVGIGRVSACVVFYILYQITRDFSLYWIFALLACLSSLYSLKTYENVRRGELHV